MPVGVVEVEILQPGEQADQLLAAAGARLETSSVRDGRAAHFWLDNATPGEAYEALQDALDAEAGDWPDYLEIKRPAPS